MHKFTIERLQGYVIIQDGPFSVFIRDGQLVICWEEYTADENEIKGIIRTVYDFMAVESTLDTSHCDDVIGIVERTPRSAPYEVNLDVGRLKYFFELDRDVYEESLTIEAPFELIGL